jgi:hypothetical protein
MDPLVSITLITLFSIVSIGLVLMIGNVIVSTAEDSSHFQEAESIMARLRDYISQVVSEGNGSSRAMSMSPKAGHFEMNMPANTIIYYMDGPEIFEHFSRKADGELFSISGNDADCKQDNNYIYMQNSRLNATFQRKGNQTSWVALNTSDIMRSIMQVDSNTSIILANSSVMIDDQPQSSYGNGYSELLNEEENQPFCIVHFFINSTCCAYDIYYTLFSGADFLVQEIRGSLTSRAITSNYALHINSTDIIRVNGSTSLSTDLISSTYVPDKRFISSQANGTSFGMAFAGKFFKNISLNTTYPGSNYLFQMRQSYENNRILVAFTNGTWESFDSHMDEISSDRIVGSQFGNFTETHPSKLRTSVVLLPDDINLTNTLTWGSGYYEFMIANRGKVNNVTNVEIKMR